MLQLSSADGAALGPESPAVIGEGDGQLRPHTAMEFLNQPAFNDRPQLAFKVFGEVVRPFVARVTAIQGIDGGTPSPRPHRDPGEGGQNDRDRSGF